ncbi:MAG: helix-turn-helix transcriptional regulator [Clostridia bacterium]|nr:helix-turn-helix transcriptional regulator [Clostridia bacterium]
MEKAFSLRLRQLRVEKGVTQKQMSRDLMMTENYIYNIESQIAYPSMTQFFAICEYLDIQPSAFMQFEPEQTAKEEELLEAVKGFSNEKMDRLIRIAETI